MSSNFWEKHFYNDAQKIKAQKRKLSQQKSYQKDKKKKSEAAFNRYLEGIKKPIEEFQQLSDEEILQSSDEESSTDNKNIEPHLLSQMDEIPKTVDDLSFSKKLRNSNSSSTDSLTNHSTNSSNDSSTDRRKRQ